MLKSLRSIAFLAFILSLCFAAIPASAQLGNSGSVVGVVKDESGGVVAGAKVEVANPVSGFKRELVTDSDGNFRLTNVPFNPYHMNVIMAGFEQYSQDVDVRSTVPTTLQITLKVGKSATSITVEAGGGDLVETESTFHTDVDQKIIDRLPLESASSSLTSLVTLVSPGVAADSNGNMHGLGDHRPNQQSVFEPTVPGCSAVDRSNLWSAAGGVRRQDQSGDQSYDKVGPGCDNTDGQRDGLLRKFWHQQSGIQSRLWRREMGQFYRGERIAERPIPGRAGVLGVPRQGKRGKYF
jgi:hypothetical protein